MGGLANDVRTYFSQIPQNDFEFYRKDYLTI